MENEKLIKDAQYRKGLSIAFFNATNNATEIIKVAGGARNNVEMKEAIIYWRDWLLAEHAKYYGNVIAKVGSNYKPEDAIEKLNASKTVLELESNWRCLSADERQDVNILKVAQEKKKALNENA